MPVEPDVTHRAASILVDAATTDTWSEMRDGFVRLFGVTADPDVVRRRMDSTAGRVVATSEADRDQVRAAAVTSWQTRLADLLEEHPGLELELRALIHRATAQPSMTFASHDQSTMIVAPGGTVNVTPSRKHRP